MALPHTSPAYERWAPVVARWIFAGIFLHSAWYKIPGTETFDMQVGFSEAAGIPFPAVAVSLAFVLEIIASAMLIFGWNTRMAAVALIAFLVLIVAFFVRDLTDQMQLVTLFSSLGLIAGLLYVSVYGARSVAIRKDL